VELSQVTVFPKDPSHRLVGQNLSTFFDRLSERVIALGAGATAEVIAGDYRMRAYTHTELVTALDEARTECAGRHDLDVRLWGDVRDDYARFVGSRTGVAQFKAFVQPTEIGARLCGSCDTTLNGSGDALACSAGCADATPTPALLLTCWTLTLSGEGTNGLGGRFHDEGRRLSESLYLTTFQGTAGTPLHEWHS
jgi:hypothetical protein